MPDKHEWWQKGIIYQLYPHSFMDSNGDGVGDLAGVLHQLDYLEWLGVDALWLSPIYPSPMADFGYDISNYTDIHPLFGTLADFDELVAEVHRRHLKLILDFVPNHTSDQHPWFLEARASRSSAKRDWYIWRDPTPGGGPPNNWLSNFGGSAWELDEATGQYYYHAFLKQQPDLNWRNPVLRAAMHDVLRFWLRRGVDGFRVDVIWHIIKDDQFRDNPDNPHYASGQNPHHAQLATFTADQPEVHKIIAELRDVVDEYPHRMMVGEIYLPVERLITYYGEGGEGVHMPFNFQLITLGWNADTINAAIQGYEKALPPYAWPNWVLGNHDNPRICSRVGHAQTRVAAMLLLTLRGTPTLYYGDEIGMHDVRIPPDRVQDPFEKNVPGMGLGRDPERTPMQWDDSRHAGFTRGEPWLPVSEDYRVLNVAAQQKDHTSLLTLYKRLIGLRRQEAALMVGGYEAVPGGQDLIAFLRHYRGAPLLIVLNLGPHAQTYSPPEKFSRGKIVLSTHLDREGEEVRHTLTLRGDEGIIVRP